MSVVQGFRLVAAGCLDQDPGPQPEIRHGGLPARQLFALSRGWDLDAETGLYQALGREKLVRFGRMYDKLDAEGGYDAQKPAAILLQFLPYGPFCHLAITRGLRGPFQPLEAGAASGAVALLAGVDDLVAGRCRHALVGGLDGDRATLCWLTREPGLRLARGRTAAEAEAALGSAVRWCEPSADPHGLDGLRAMLAATEPVGLVVHPALAITLGPDRGL